MRLTRLLGTRVLQCLTSGQFKGSMHYDITDLWIWAWVHQTFILISKQLHIPWTLTLSYCFPADKETVETRLVPHANYRRFEKSYSISNMYLHCTQTKRIVMTCIIKLVYIVHFETSFDNWLLVTCTLWLWSTCLNSKLSNRKHCGDCGHVHVFSEFFCVILNA